MPHESSEDSSNQPDGPMGSPKCSPWPPGTPRPPPSTPNDSKTGLLSSLNSSDHLACFSNHQMTHQMSLLILWDISPLPLDPLGPSRPTLWPHGWKSGIAIISNRLLHRVAHELSPARHHWLVSVVCQTRRTARLSQRRSDMLEFVKENN